MQMKIEPMKPDDLAKLMKRLQVNQTDVARGIGVSSAAVSRWLGGTRDLSNPVATAIRLWAKSYRKPA